MSFNLYQFLKNVVVSLRARLADKLEVKTFTKNLTTGTEPRWGIEQDSTNYFVAFADVSEADLMRLKQVKPGNVLKLPNKEKPNELTRGQ